MGQYKTTFAKGDTTVVLSMYEETAEDIPHEQITATVELVLPSGDRYSEEREIQDTQIASKSGFFGWVQQLLTETPEQEEELLKSALQATIETAETETGTPVQIQPEEVLTEFRKHTHAI